MWAALALSGCFNPTVFHRRSLSGLIASQDFDAAAARLRKAKESEYGRRNAVLYHLDLGMVLHHAGRYAESDEHLDRAESRMEELYTKSVRKMAATMTVNDALMDYAGEPYERALLNTVRALNWVFMGKPDEALVEARKVEQFLDELGRRRRSAAYKDDGYARYLDSLLYEDEGFADDARISREAALKAYGAAAPVFEAPPSTAPTGEIVFIHYNGPAPRKVSSTLQVLWKDGVAALRSSRADRDEEEALQMIDNAAAAALIGNAITVSVPDLEQEPYEIVASELRVPGREAHSVLVSDLSTIARKQLEDRMAAIRLRAIARATAKYVLVKAAADAAEKKKKGTGWLAAAAGEIFAAATETADTRGWSAMPAQVRMARLSLPPGKYSVEALFKDADETIVGTYVFKDVVVRKGRRTYLHYRTAR